MNQLNAFNNEPAEDVGDAVTAIVCTLLGIAALVAAAFLDLRLAVALSWGLLVVGIALGVASPQRRATAAGLAVAGIGPPLAIFVFCWVWISGQALFG